jgi:hypothetical protein
MVNFVLSKTYPLRQLGVLKQQQNGHAVCMAVFFLVIQSLQQLIGDAEIS